MRSLTLGCLGILIGIALVLAAALAAFLFLNPAVDRAPLAAAPAVSAPDVAVSASAGFLQSQIEPTIVQSGLAQQAMVTLAAPNIIQVSSPVHITVLGQSMTVNTTVTMAISVQNGRVLLKTTQVEAAGVQVPQSVLTARFETLRALGEDLINRQMQRALQGTSLKLINVVVTPDAMTAQFKYSP